MQENNKERHFYDDLCPEKGIGQHGRFNEAAIAAGLHVEADHVHAQDKQHHEELEVEVELNERAAGKNGNVEHELVQLKVVEGGLRRVFAAAAINEVLIVLQSGQIGQLEGVEEVGVEKEAALGVPGHTEGKQQAEKDRCAADDVAERPEVGDD